MSDFLLKLGEIVLLNILLSGDNAIVIGMASRGLNERHRRRAILAGGLGAVAMRIAFTFVIATLLDIPYIHLIGGVLLLYIAWTLLRPEAEADERAAATGLWSAIGTIIAADAVMSLDNVVAITAAADGDLSLLIVGIALSIPIVLFGSDLLSRLLSRFPVLIYVGVLVLVFTAIEIAAEEEVIHDWHAIQRWEEVTITAIAAIVVFGAGWASRRGSASPDGHGIPPTGA
ncbi:MAG TPA: TerC family protein [Thermomicrobiales bacterium]|jgi:YjbE family integral membrane protein|nr:TerC family protein [Thermomicrobiales bacterium]